MIETDNPQDLLKHLKYEPETGKFYWGARQRNYVGSIGRGFCRMKIKGRSFQRSRLVWLVETGSFPAGLLTHINGDKTDDRFSNLRLLSYSQHSKDAKGAMERALVDTDNPQDLLRCFRYEPETGKFYWKISTGVGAVLGQEAGWKDGTGTKIITINGRQLLRRQLVWLAETGILLPARKRMYHINGDKTDDRFSNLRLGTRFRAAKELREEHERHEPIYARDVSTDMTSANTSGHKHLAQMPSGSWRLQLTARWRKYTHVFCTLEEAIAYRDKLIAELRGEFAAEEQKQKSPNRG